MPRPWSSALLPVLLLAALALHGAPPAFAKLEGSEWQTVEAEYKRLWMPPPGRPGFEADKASLVNLLLKDGEARSYKMLVDGLVGECALWHAAQSAVHKQVDEIAKTLTKPSKDRTKEEEATMFKLQAELPKLEDAARVEKVVLDTVVKAIAEGPPALRQNLYARAKGPSEWLFRAAVAQVAAAQPTEKDAAAFLARVLNPTAEKDPRVRIAAVEALAPLPEGGEEHVVGRIADPDWGVQLKAVGIVGDKKITRAIPHLIAALERAGPRLQDVIGKALKDVTGENFDAYADVWAKWWEANKEKFQAKDAVKVGGRPKDPQPDPTIYGVPIKSDRVLFIIDVSGSMDKPSTNKPPPPPKPTGPVTPKDGDPPPPPPEEVISGKKIDVAKHELKKAIEKLPKTAMFSIIAFNHASIVWKEQAVIASAENKEEALKWVRGMQPSGSTYSDGALRLGFRMAGIGAIDKAYPEVAIDTIMFISDGAPTDNAPDASKLMDHNIILQHVREWNLQKRVVINCIAVDMQPGNEFMQKLAAENGGVFVDR
jgi:hypothetical protein